MVNAPPLLRSSLGVEFLLFFIVTNLSIPFRNHDFSLFPIIPYSLTQTFPIERLYERGTKVFSLYITHLERDTVFRDGPKQSPESLKNFK